MGKEPTRAGDTGHKARMRMEAGIERLENALQLARKIDPGRVSRTDPLFTLRPTILAIETAVSETFGTSSTDYKRFADASNFFFSMLAPEQIPLKAEQFRSRATQTLEAAIALLRSRLETQEAEAVLGPSAPTTFSNRIFIVHGHDDGAREAVARFLQSLGFEPVILHEQANRGRTIISKFRDEANEVGFAVVLLTPDDEVAGGKKRARQNVVLELGFFLGVLGPERVAAIIKGAVDLPSDYEGVVYIPFDAEWKIQLGKELEAAGYAIDWNLVMRR
jgi:predicted nucleotide-binding protein